MNSKKQHPAIKSNLHPKNRHRERYDFKVLIEICPELKPFVQPNKYNEDSIDFFDPLAVKMLNRALLKQHYDIQYWDIPEGYLCPPIPGRADYIHHIAELLGNNNFGKIPVGEKMVCLDIGIGANCVYPIIGQKEYGWSFIGSEIDAIAIESASTIVEKNPSLKGKVDIRYQVNSNDILYGVLKKSERVDLVICNPPFHDSKVAAEAGSLRKLRNLKQEKVKKVELNFGGQAHELWCDGGEKKFINNLIRESKKFAESCFWFSTLVSKKTHLKGIEQSLRNERVTSFKTIPMGQGNKSSHIAVWTFLNKEQQKDWKLARWK
ncbi:MAG: 23S rRNA (adenine(1618)-N(6))-methyltransferase RlmF [Chitinophagales bacterium]